MVGATRAVSGASTSIQSHCPGYGGAGRPKTAVVAKSTTQQQQRKNVDGVNHNKIIGSAQQEEQPSRVLYAIRVQYATWRGVQEKRWA